jgi:hypothetical protein
VVDSGARRFSPQACPQRGQPAAKVMSFAHHSSSV